LAASQYDYRERRSTDTSLHHLVTKVDVQLEAKRCVIGSIIDIDGAFDSTSKVA